MTNHQRKQHKKRIMVPAGEGIAVALAEGQHIRVVNTHGTQVVDTWAFRKEDPHECLSMEHCREVLQKIFFQPGDRLVTNRYRPILTLLSDTSPGGHDTLIAACSKEMYAHMGHNGTHANCVDNLTTAVKPFRIPIGLVPSPWNLFMLAPVTTSGGIEYLRPRSAPGDYVELRADVDCIMAFSACPDDVYPTNGGDGRPRDIHLVVFEDLPKLSAEGHR